MRFSPIFLPFAVFLIFLLILAFRVLRFLTKVRATFSDGQLGKEIHLETPVGAIDIKPQQGADPDLASIPKYPGATPAHDLVSPRYEADLNVPGHSGRYASESFRTDDQVETVLGFYRRELPDWQQDRFYQHGYRLIHENAGCQHAITIQHFGGRTTIEHAVVHPKQETSKTGTTFSSDSNFGVLR
jgi:hypothetical protein